MPDCEKCNHWDGGHCVTGDCVFEPIKTQSAPQQKLKKFHVEDVVYDDAIPDEEDDDVTVEEAKKSCQYVKPSGEKCSRKAQENSIYCWQHP